MRPLDNGGDGYELESKKSEEDAAAPSSDPKAQLHAWMTSGKRILKGSMDDSRIHVRKLLVFAKAQGSPRNGRESPLAVSYVTSSPPLPTDPTHLDYCVPSSP